MPNPPRTPDEAAGLFEVGGETLPKETAKVPPLVTATGKCGGYRPGDRIGDFVILRLLGSGTFADVYLAQQVSLDREVALKVSDRSAIGEAQLLAGLEHDHIVKVYSEFVDPQSRSHCLVLQYIPGTTLAKVIRQIYQGAAAQRSGGGLLAAIDGLSMGEIGFDPAASHNREILSRLPFAEAVCRMGVQLAEALSFAHARGILHCDIKPANILLNRYGRPMLVDFNVSVAGARRSSGELIGGTLDYMAPEYLALFAGAAGRTAAVDHRCDIYSLGVVLFELAAGRLPFVREGPQTPLAVQRWLKQRETFPADSGLPGPLERVLRRCLHPDPAQRYQSGVELAQALQNAGELLAAERRLPPGGKLTRAAQARPFLMLVALTFLPHLIGSVVNIAYNAIQIHLDGDQQQAFQWLVIGYNAVMYPLCLFLAYRVIRPVYVGWQALHSREGLADAELDRLRSRALRLGDWGNVIACLGWLPGGVFFPIGLDLLAGPVPGSVYTHFLLSFSLSGLIALIYSHFGIQFVVLRVFYPRLGEPNQLDRPRAAAELTRAGRWFDLFQCLAAVVPLVGAILLVAFTGEHLTLGLRLLLTSLIMLGMFGVGVVVIVRYRLNRIIQMLAAGTSDESAFPSGMWKG
jgi:hypothetical protein